MRQLPGLYWDETKKRYFPETSKPKTKQVSPYEDSEDSFSNFGHRNPFRMKIERTQPMHLPFNGPTTATEEFVFACTDGFTIKKYCNIEGELVLKDEIRSIKQVQAIYCTKSFLLVTHVPQDLDASGLEACLYHISNTNNVTMIEILNYPFKQPIVEVDGEVAYISGSSELMLGNRNLGKIKNPRALFYHPNVGIVVATTNGKIKCFHGPDYDKITEWKLEHSSAIDLFYAELLGSLLALTFHGDLIRIDFESGEQAVLASKLPERIILCYSYIIFVEDGKVRFLNLLNSTDSFSLELEHSATQIFLQNIQILYK